MFLHHFYKEEQLLLLFFCLFSWKKNLVYLEKEEFASRGAKGSIRVEKGFKTENARVVSP